MFTKRERIQKMNKLKLTLKEFITNFIKPNSLIRLWYEDGSAHTTVGDDSLRMEWEWLISKYRDYEVIGITDILVKKFPEAINIILKRKSIS